MSRLHQVLGHGRRVRHDLDRARAVGGANAGRDAARGIDAHLEIRFERFAVLHDHSFDAQLLQPVRGGRHTDQSSTELGHEINRLRCRGFGGHDQIALVLAVGIVHHDHHLALPQVLNDALDGIKRCFHRLPINLSGPPPTASNKKAIRATNDP